MRWRQLVRRGIVVDHHRAGGRGGDVPPVHTVSGEPRGSLQRRRRIRAASRIDAEPDQPTVGWLHPSDDSCRVPSGVPGVPDPEAELRRWFEQRGLRRLPQLPSVTRGEHPDPDHRTGPDFRSRAVRRRAARRVQPAPKQPDFQGSPAGLRRVASQSRVHDDYYDAGGFVMIGLRGTRRLLVGNLVIAAVLTGLVVAGVTSVFSSASANTAPRTVRAQLGDVSASVSATGNVSPAQAQNVDFSTGGTVTEIDVTAGQSVTTGQVLAKLDPGPAQASLTAAEDSLQAAQDNLALVQSGGETPPQKAQDQATLSAAESQVSTAQSNLTAAQDQLGSDRAQCAKSGASAGTTACSAVGSDQQSVNQAQNSLTQAQNTLTQEQLSIQAKQYVNPAAVLQDEAAVTQAQAVVAQDQKTLSETTLTAPFSGTITALNGTVGETVTGGGSSNANANSGSSGTGSGTGSGSGAGSSSAGSSSSGSSGSSSSVFLTLTNMSQLQVIAGFAEADATRVAIGQPATVTFSALTSTTVPGRVTAVSATSTVVSNVVTYNVTVALQNPPTTVKPGMTTTVSVVVASAGNVLELPTSAISTAGRASTVTVLQNGKQTVQPVAVGLVGDTSTQILSGLSAGDVVVIPTATVSSGGSGTGSSRNGTVGGFGGLGGGLGGGGLGGGGAVRIGGGG